MWLNRRCSIRFHFEVPVGVEDEPFLRDVELDRAPASSHLPIHDRQNVVYAAACSVVIPRSPKRGP